MSRADYIVIGGGIVGLATAHRLLVRTPDAAVTVLEKESEIATHQTGHNSGVIHSGVYYKPGSHKAINCREGKAMLERFCDEHGIPYEVCGKVIVAVDDSERPALQNIFERGQANGVACEMIGQERLRELEPHASGVAAIHVREAGIVNYRRVCEKLAELIQQRGGTIRTGAAVRSLVERRDVMVVRTRDGREYQAGQVVNCAGLHSDHIAAMSGRRPSVRIVPFRGEYYELNDEAKGLCRNLIYPVPDPKFPFLGVHFTRMIGGAVECGPNAVLALAREGYTKSAVNLHELAETLSYPAFWKITLRYWRTGAGEMWRSVSKAAFVRALQRLVPEIQAEHLKPAPAGVRAQALSPDGKLLDDFAFERQGRLFSVLNAPSPAATASLSIARHVVEAVGDGVTQRR